MRHITVRNGPSPIWQTVPVHGSRPTRGEDPLVRRRRPVKRWLCWRSSSVRSTARDGWRLPSVNWPWSGRTTAGRFMTAGFRSGGDCGVLGGRGCGGGGKRVRAPPRTPLRTAQRVAAVRLAVPRSSRRAAAEELARPSRRRRNFGVVSGRKALRRASFGYWGVRPSLLGVRLRCFRTLFIYREQFWLFLDIVLDRHRRPYLACGGVPILDR